jgi:hypothetical protein
MQLPTTHPTQRDIAWYVAECADLKEQLASEVEAKRNHLRIACEEINHLNVKAGFYEREIARLRADQLRMDWLEKHGATYICSRAAIDAARKEVKP